MGLISCHALFQVEGRIRRIEKIRILVQIVHTDRHHGLGKVHGVHRILVIPALHDEGQIGLCRQKRKEELELLISGDRLLQCFPAGDHRFLRHSALDESLLCPLDLVLRIRKLQIQELNHCTDRQLPVLDPGLAVIPEKIRCLRKTKLSAVFLREGLGLSDIGVVRRLQGIIKVRIILLRRHISVRGLHLLPEKLQRRVPYGLQLLIGKRRITFQSFIQEDLLCLICLSEALQGSPCEMGQRIIPVALLDRPVQAPACRLLFRKLCLFLMKDDLCLLIDRGPALMPDDVIAV